MNLKKNLQICTSKLCIMYSKFIEIKGKIFGLVGSSVEQLTLSFRENRYDSENLLRYPFLMECNGVYGVMPIIIIKMNEQEGAGAQ